MRELPIIFNTEMVRAILDGKKTMTRRPVKPQPINDRVGMINAAYCGRPNEWLVNGAVSEYTCNNKQAPIWRPQYYVGDVLYVRETWRENGTIAEPFAYKADEPTLNLIGENENILTLRYKWRPSIHMPKWAARIHLLVTEVRCERVQDIKEHEAQQEGWDLSNLKLDETYDCTHHARDWFHALWDSLYSKQGSGWDANPWVWVYRFEVKP